MATFRLVLDNLFPDLSGNAYPKPSVIDDANDLIPHERVALKDGGNGAVGVKFQVPKNYTGNPKFYAMWLSPATTGNCRLTASYQTVAAGASFDPASAEETLTAVDAAAAGTTLGVTETDLGAATAANFAVDDWVLATVQRAGGHANDTMTAEALLEAIIFQYDG